MHSLNVAITVGCHDISLCTVMAEMSGMCAASIQEQMTAVTACQLGAMKS